MLKVPRSSLLRYVVVVSSVGLALVLTLQLDLLSRRIPFGLFFAAVIISTWYGGRHFGLLAILLSALASDYFILPPRYSFRLDSINLLEGVVFIGVSLIITSLTFSRERSAKSRRQTGEHYRLLFESNPHPMWVYDLDTLKFLTVNEAAIHHYGYTREEFLSLAITDIRPQEDIPSLLENVSQVNGTLDSAGTWRHRRKDGSMIVVEVVSHGLTLDGKRAELVMAHDVTERQRVEQERERFFELSADLQVLAGFDGRFKWVSPACERALGWSWQELTSEPWLHFVHTGDHEKTIAEAQKLFSGQETIAFENRYRHKDGSYRWMSWRARPYLNEQLIYCTAADITERKQLEEQLRQSQKLESIGQLAGGIAHDFNNLLTVITGYNDLCLSRLAHNDPVRRNLEQIKTAADRASSLTRQLLAFSRKQILQPKVVDLTTTVRNMDKMLQRLIGEDIELVTILDPKLANIKADPGQIEQVLMNLAVNARDAMPEGGKLTVETKNVHLDEAYARQHVGASAGPHVMLAVSDTGHGMDAATQARIYEPFFTTKEQGKGTGLGLSMVYGIVRQSGGNIWVYSEPNHGTTFKVYLPIVEEEGEVVDEGSIKSKPEQGTETILVVEDDDAVRLLLLDILESEG
jgi:two-component system, cell cycle sensor histidine kinase and response regulator CckA